MQQGDQGDFRTLRLPVLEGRAAVILSKLLHARLSVLFY